jgi:type VI protein secretion system component VasK
MPVILGLALAGWIMVAIWRSAKKKAAKPTPRASETKEERKKREREEQRQRRLRDMAKFLADPRLLR